MNHLRQHLHVDNDRHQTAANAESISDADLVEIRAAQRTFEGAYVRTALGQFGFALVVLRIFTTEFYAIGTLFAVYGALVLLVALYRRHHSKDQFFFHLGDDGSQSPMFRTSGNVVVILTALNVAAYVTLMVLVIRLKVI